MSGNTTRAFPIADVIGTITGRLIGKMEGIYALSQFMCGEPVWIHQLARVGREICPVVLRQHPEIEPVIEEAGTITKDNLKEKLEGWTSRFGETIALSPMTPNDHEPIDPISELTEMTHPDRIITVAP